MRTYRITITMPDGSRGHCYGLYSHGFDAAIAVMTHFPTAQRISVRPCHD